MVRASLLCLAAGVPAIQVVEGDPLAEPGQRVFGPCRPSLGRAPEPAAVPCGEEFCRQTSEPLIIRLKLPKPVLVPTRAGAVPSGACRNILGAGEFASAREGRLARPVGKAPKHEPAENREGDIRPGRKPGPHPRPCRATCLASLLVASSFLGGCSGIQSALDPAGEEAPRRNAVLGHGGRRRGHLVGVIGRLLYASRGSERSISEDSCRPADPLGRRGLSRRLLLGAAGLCALADAGAAALCGDEPMPALRVEVTGEQFWWRVAYRLPDGQPVAAANEIRLPVGERVEFVLDERRRHPLVLDPVARRQDGHDPRPHQPPVAAGRPSPASTAATAPNSAARRTR